MSELAFESRIPIGRASGQLLPLLLRIQESKGFIPQGWIPLIAQTLKMTTSEVYSVITYYPSFSLQSGSRFRRQAEFRMEEAFHVHLKWPEVLDSSAVLPGQNRRILGRVQPLAFAGIRRARSLSPQNVIDELRTSGLRGTGGAAFPTWLKWESAAKASGHQRYIICNAAEGDLGAYVDRAVLERDPFAIIEGMAIAGHAVGARSGYVYIRSEYPEAVKIMNRAIQEVRDRNLLEGAFELEVFPAAGTYVCGEETALLNSMEGRPGHPRHKPPFPTQAGLWGCPTVVNNVKTLAHVAWILEHGASQFTQLGTQKSRGTAVLSICGPVRNPGVIEVPMGTTLREVIFGVCGGMLPGKSLKAVQTGGPLGGLVPEILLDTPISFEDLGQIGSPLGSGGMIVISDESCIVSAVQKFAEFAKEESCGHCAPCRLGTLQLERILREWIEGKGQERDFAFVADISSTLKSSSFCAFGQGVPGILNSALKYFPNEFQEHVRLGRCPAGQCSLKAKGE